MACTLRLAFLWTREGKLSRSTNDAYCRLSHHLQAQRYEGCGTAAIFERIKEKLMTLRKKQISIR